jgi:hypothetical protein
MNTPNNLIKYENTTDELKIDNFDTYNRYRQTFINQPEMQIIYQTAIYSVVLQYNYQFFNKKGDFEDNKFSYKVKCFNNKAAHFNFDLVVSVNEDFKTAFDARAELARLTEYNLTKEMIAKQNKTEEEKNKKQAEELKTFLTKNKVEEVKIETAPVATTIQEKFNNLLKMFEYKKIDFIPTLLTATNYEGITVFKYVKNENEEWFENTQYDYIAAPTKITSTVLGA